MGRTVSRGRAVWAFAACAVAVAGCADTKAVPPTATSTTVASANTTKVGSLGPPASNTQPATSTTVGPTKTILELAKNEGSLTTLLKLLDTANLTKTLEGKRAFTLVAPSDAAFAKLDPATLDKISNDVTLLKAVLQYHIIPKRLTNTDVAAGTVVTVEGSSLTLVAAGTLPTINGLAITRAAKALNGTIVIIESVLLPPDVTIP
jgi:transforming growth factor-beta-induced protein